MAVLSGSFDYVLPTYSCEGTLLSFTFKFPPDLTVQMRSVQCNQCKNDTACEFFKISFCFTMQL